jgi:8-oxo-dGTP pyrophosphatase MutT (NUDIX family)
VRSTAGELPEPPPDMVERARAFRASGATPAVARPSATVVLLRDGESGLETYLLRRRAELAFAGGMHVFPGGVVDPADAAGTDLERSVALAAIRETFEETSVLLATGRSPSTDVLEAERLALIAHECGLADVLARHGMAPDLAALRPWSRWTTPESEPRRYDTWFFVARLPPGAQPRDVGGEADAAGWISPEDAVAAADRGEYALLLPTRTTLVELSVFGSAAAAFAAAAERRPTRRLAAIDLDHGPPRFTFRDAE